MKGFLNLLKGRIKEAAGALSGNNKLRSKGREDQAIGQVEKSAEKDVEKTKEVADDMVDRAKDTAEKKVEKVEKETK